MNITLAFQHALHTALSALAGKIAGATVQSAPVKAPSERLANSAAFCRTNPNLGHTSRSRTEARHSDKPLRIVRVLESGQTRTSVGRMVISGRMADVCAELDRLVAHEATLH